MNDTPTNPPLMLSVSGARGIVGETMTPEITNAFANAFVSFLHEKLGKLPTLCVARDSRPSGPSLQDAVAKAFVASGCCVTDLGVVATPTAGVMINALQADGGIIVTASHNPTPWNGLKCLDGDGLAPSKDEAEEIIRRFHARISLPHTNGGVLEVNNQGNDTHIAKVLGIIDPQPIRDCQFRVVLDSINGAGCKSGLKLLELLGCEVWQLNGEPTGEFAHTPEPKSENLTDLSSMVDKFDADVGFAQDPDADRLAIVDETGFYFGEEYTLVLAAMRWLEENPNSSVATNLSTSRMIDDVAKEFGCTTWRSAVGEANVAGAMKEHGCVVGGEGNGGVIFPQVCWVRDSLSGMALVLDLMRKRKEKLSSIVRSIQPYEMIKRTIDLADLGGIPAIEKEIDRLKKTYADECMDDSDGLRIDFDEGWIHVRPSNTEPIARVIAEAVDSLTAYKLSNRVKLGKD
ncbi:MAG: phosphoglucosamine mutase [Phycisphaerae bacterium]|jgi:phosphomannomutase|nr:phosphoglucosamine mutase [Phycisphaerae bacterium]